MSLEFRRVTGNTFAPHVCICGSHKDLADTHMEDALGGRRYVCKLCTLRLARVFGLVEGPQQEKLLAADTKVGLAEKQAAEAALQAEELQAQLNTLRLLHETTCEELEWERGRRAQLEAGIRAKAQEELALVGGLPVKGDK